MTSSKDQPVRKGFFEYCEIILEILLPPFIWLYRYSGLEFIIRKFNPPNNSGAFPTGIIWLIGIYVAFFSVASQRYENRIDIIENRANSIFAQLATDACKKALGRIPTVQAMQCPEKPVILDPPSVFRSLLKQTRYHDMVKLLKETIEDWKTNLDGIDLHSVNLEKAKLHGSSLQESILEGANLRGADLRRAILSGAILRGANLSDADLRGAILWKANLEGANLGVANLQGANLIGADLRKADLQGAILSGAGLRRADFRGVDLRGADFWEANLQGANLGGAKGLTVKRLCNALTLYEAELDQELETQIKQECPDLLKELQKNNPDEKK